MDQGRASADLAGHFEGRGLSSRLVLGLDIGGANLKAAHSRGLVRSRPFALWKNPAGLAAALAGFVGSLPPFDLLAVAMTGELCDCYQTKRQGVNAILDAVEAVAGSVPVQIWQTSGEWAGIAAARAAPLRTAASNWLALAAFAGRFAPHGPCLVIDVGSTTTDIVPLLVGKPVPNGRTDPERMRCRELVYTGIRRTPVCAVLGPAVAAELFATTLDAYLVLGSVPENADDRETADGRPATKAHAKARLARMLCADGDSCTTEEILQLARQVNERQLALIGQAMADVARCLPGPPQTVVLAGAGEFLAKMALGISPARKPARVVSLAEKLGPDVSQAACAYALAVLATEFS